MADLVIRDSTTGESRTFTPTREGYAAAEAFKQSIADRGHRVSDDSSGSLGRIGDFFGSNGNLGRPGSPSSWF